MPGGGDGRSFFSLQCPGFVKPFSATWLLEFDQFSFEPFSMNKDWVLTKEAFDALLAWLDPEREEAGRKYEQIRERLIKIFTCRGCFEPEDMADETINRVSKRLNEIQSTYEGDPARYFYGVASKVLMEYQRPKPTPAPPPIREDTDRLERDYACLEECVEKLTPSNRELVMQYYQEEKRAKIEHRKELAEQFGIALNALRIRAHRIRTALQQCVEGCVREETI
jgi:DNA-directed RNA polymerase specialized sigma24 family protein